MGRKIAVKSKSASYHQLNTKFNDSTSYEKTTTKKDSADTLSFTFIEIPQIEIVLKHSKI